MNNAPSLKEKTFNAVLWNFLGTIGGKVFQLVPTMILARLLSPSDYGVVAISAVITGLITIFVNGGFSYSIVQKKNIDDLDLCSIYYFNIFSSLFFYVCLWFAAPSISNFFQMNEVVAIIRISSLGLIIGSLSNVQATIFKRNLDYKHITQRNLVAQIISAIAGIICACFGLSYWALVVQSLVSTTSITIINWRLSDWNPTFKFSFIRLKLMFGYNGKLLLKNLSDYGFDKVYDVSIGKLYSSSELSYFNRAYATINLFIQSFLDVLNNVAFPAFSRMQSEKVRLKNNIIRFLKIESMLIFTVLLCICALSESLFHVLYSSKWDSVIPLFRILCLWALFRPVSYIFTNGLMSLGCSGICFKISFTTKVLNILLLIITWEHGLKIMMLGQVLAIYIEAILYTFYFNKFFGYSFKRVILDLLPYLSLAIVFAMILYGVDYYIFSLVRVYINSEFWGALCSLMLGMFLSIWGFIFVNKKMKLSAYTDFRNILLDYFKNNAYINKLIRLFM